MKQFLSKIQILSSFSLKIIAVITMFIDHVGVIFYPHLSAQTYVALRSIGRISFPIFAFLLVEGFLHTRDRLMYLGRLLGFGMVIVIFQSILTQYFGITFGTTNFNIFITLGIGLLAIWFIEYYWEVSPFITICGIILCTTLFDFVRVEYGTYGILLIVFFYVTRNNRWLQVLSLVGMTCLYVGSDYLYAKNADFIQIFAILASPFLLMYNGKKGKYSLKYFFYLFYPLHLAFLYLLEAWMTK